MSKRTLTQEEKMRLWYKGTRKLNITACSDSKLVENHRICCESGYFVQAAILRKELYKRGYISNLQPKGIPTDYYINHTKAEVMEDLLKYIDTYITSSGYSVENNGLKLKVDGYKIYYGWNEYAPDLIIDTYNGTAKFTGHPEIFCTRNLELVLKLLREELFYDL